MYCRRSPRCRRKLPFLYISIQRTWPPRVFQFLSVIHPPATCFDGCQLGCTSTLSFVASVSPFLLRQKLVNLNSKDDTWSHITKRDNPNVMGTIPWSLWHLPGGWLALLSSVVFHFNQVIALRVCVCMPWVFLSFHECAPMQKLWTFVC